MKKQILTGILSASLLFAPLTAAISAVHAATTGSITILGTQANATYKAYKLFDATVADASSNNGGVSYTIPNGIDYTDTGISTVFDLSKNGTVTYVTRKAGATDAEIADWAKKASAKLSASVTQKETGTDGKETLPVDYGYYYIASDVNSGSTVMLTSASPDATIHEKNTSSGWGNGGKKTDKTSYNVGDTITYTITYDNAVNYNGSEKVYQYVLSDDMPDASAVQLNKDYKVTVTDSNGVETVLTKADAAATKTYQVTENGNNFNLTIPWAATKTQNADSNLGGADDFYYHGINKITVTYTGVLKSGAEEGSVNATTNKNTARIMPNLVPLNSDPGKDAFVHDGQITITKIDGDTKEKLKGAEFVLINKDNKYLKFEKDSEKVEWVSDLAQATKYTTDANGSVVISGLAEGDYQLHETKAPEGYNLLKDSTTISLKKQTILQLMTQMMDF
ncbi:SpaA isopeptide-forming pilin-related protein [Streptococcus didelphis]|uniref:SpaA isopeptide-forming pilin-related protein n=1 Tax=Streptococcus didelphis TaxID=102886 RepID=UPI0027D33F0B|nr:SpaA isopeptide-forming pilin-related protein [Streptococcus didelphis]WMB29917.1 SpaA isopeptide-forming pilin-related protein [Streptococcus didelphis]